MNKRFLYISSLLLLLALGAPRFASAQADSTLRHTLSEVSVSSQRMPSSSSAQTPTQSLDAQQLRSSGAAQLSDALQQMAGVNIKDYGGIGGLKTISARGLSSQFSALTIDGVPVSGGQNGQIDLGRFSLGGTAFVSFANGQFDNLLQSAQALAAGNVVNIQSRQPLLLLRSTEGSASLTGGSYGLFSPTLSLQHRFSKRLTASAYAHYVQSKGDYPFTLYYTLSQADSTSVERRQNSQMQQFDADADLFFQIAPAKQFTAKAHYLQSFNALPGPVVFYSVNSSEHTTQQNAFVQASYRNTAHKQLHFQFLGKVQHNLDTYTDSAVHSAAQILQSRYQQREGYLSAQMQWLPTRCFSLSAASDATAATLNTNLNASDHVQRLSSLTAVTAAYKGARFSLRGNILATLIGENATTLSACQVPAKYSPSSTLHPDKSYQKLSPYLGANYLLWHDSTHHSALRLRYFYKENYRIPTFSETYYFIMSRPLEPEKALQHNLGLTFNRYSDSSGRSCAFTLDLYHNRVSNKIVAVPTQNMFLWSMMNLGRVNISGLDFKIDHSRPIGRCQLTASANYSFQRALDVTDSTSKTFRQQIPYTPLHSGGASLLLQSPWADFSFSAICVSSRYRLGQNIPQNLVRGYADLSLTISRNFPLRIGDLQLQLQALNLLNMQYEVVKNYPMPPRNYRLSLTYKW